MFSNMANAPATDEAMLNIHAGTLPWPSLMSKPAAAYADGNEIYGVRLIRLVRDEARPLRPLPFADKGIIEDMAIQIDDVRGLLKGNRQQAKNGSEEWPAVRLFAPLSRGVWLLSQIDPDDLDKAFGLCDDGGDRPILGYVSLAELASRFGHMSVRWDAKFKANRPLSAYAAEARSAGRICS